MTGPRDIERTLDAWFVDGPTVMPDRLFDAVLDQVGRTGQDPLAHLRLRLTEMNPRIRLFTVLAAALLVVVAAAAIIGGGSRNLVRATDGPTNAPSELPSTAAAVEIPDGLNATWMGGHRTMDGVDPDAGVTLELSSDATFYMTESASARAHLLRSDVVEIDTDSFRLVTRNDTRACASGDAGEYGWALSPSGRVLDIEPISDDCVARAAAVPGTYWLMDCPTQDDNCLGPLDAGSYGSQFFDPFVAAGGPWTPRYGALGFTVPTGWENSEDWPDSFKLRPQGSPDFTGILWISEVVAVSEENHCEGIQAEGVGETAQELAEWVAGLDGLATTSPKAVTIGGLDAWWLDASLDPDWTETCPFSDGAPVRGVFTDRATSEGFHWTMGPGAQSRFYFVDLGDGRAMLIDIDAPTRAGFDAMLDDAAAIVEALELPR